MVSGIALNNSIRSTDGTLTATNTPDQSGPGGNTNKGVIPVPQSSRNHHRIEFSVLSRALVGDSYPLQRSSRYTL